MREVLHRYLLERPTGATVRELLDLIFTQPGTDAEFGPRFLRTLLQGDARFAFREPDQRWVAVVHEALAASLADTEFVVVDLETTGGSPQRGSTIIEIGAVRLDRARRAHRFSRLIDPGRPLPPFITRLTGITDGMLAGQPRLGEVIAEFLEFAGDRVVVAHNARFDVSFLNAALTAGGDRTLHQPSLCTMRLARRLVPQLRRRGLDAVASHFGIPLLDRHRALGDAVMTAEIFLRFLELLAARGIQRLDQVLDLQASARDGRVFFCPLPRSTVTRLPERPGVYRFYDAAGKLLYIGKAKSLRRRVQHYLSNAGGHSHKTLDLIRHVHAVKTEEAGSELEAALMEAEAIRTEQPPYNQLSKHLPRIAFLALTSDAPFPRLMISSRPTARSGRCFGPFRSRESAARVIGLVTRLFKLRTCPGHLHPDPAGTPCLQGQIGACTAPCVAQVSPPAYGEQVALFARLMAGDEAVIEWAGRELAGQREAHAAALRFEAAARVQRDLEQLERVVRRQRTLGWIVAQHHFLVLQPSLLDGTALAYLVVSGRLAWRCRLSSSGELKDLAARADESLQRGPQPIRAADIDGTAIIAAWLRDRGERDGFVFRLEDANAASRQLADWEAALASILARTPQQVDGACRLATPSDP